MNLDVIASHGGKHLEALMHESQAEIKAALQAAIEEAEAQEIAAKLKMRFAITINVDQQIASYALTFGIQRKYEAAERLPDPNQPELPLANPATEQEAQ